MTSSVPPTWLSIVRLLRWDKPTGRLILMIPALWGFCLATGRTGEFKLPLLAIIILGTLATSAAGCVVNDLWDRNIDPQVERTKNRPLAARALSVKVGIGVLFFSLICAAILARYLNLATFWLCLAAVPVILLYPAAKRVFPVPQLVLSIAWGFAVLISWSMVEPRLEPATWELWGATVFWTLGFDTVYAMPDRADDSRIGVNSSALFFGKQVPLAVGICYLLTFVLLAFAGRSLNLNIVFWISLACGAGVWFNQYRRLRHPNLLPASYGNMFRENVWLGFGLVAGMIGGLVRY
jgi:4-hydroxybenzoate polyprenyltransferase